VITLNTSLSSKLSKLKNWWTLPDAAKYLSGTYGNEVTEADILRFALDGYLKLSIYLAAKADAKQGCLVNFDTNELYAEIENGRYPEELKWGTLKDSEEPCLLSVPIDNDRFLNIEDKVEPIEKGVWDLPMIGHERIVIEEEWFNLTSSPAVIRQRSERQSDQVEPPFKGLFIEGCDGTINQLHIRRDKLSNLSRKESVKQTHNVLLWPMLRAVDMRVEDYFPAAVLPYDSRLVIRSEALEEFEQFIYDNEIEKKTITKPHGNTERYAANREQVLGAAFAVLAKWPEVCKDEKGEPVASKIAAMVDAKADLFWTDAQPPLATDSIADHLRDWIRKANSNRK
jgi:hypothetical protein